MHAAGWLLVIALIAMCPTPTRAQDAVTPAWLVFQVVGDARVRPAGQDPAPDAWTPLEQGAQVSRASEIRTGPDGRVSLVRGEDVMHVMPATTMTIPARADTSLLTRIRLFLGKIFVGVELRPGERFEVETPHLAAIVKGTSFSVGTSEQRAEVAVAEGVVGVTSVATGQTIEITPGQSASVSQATGGTIAVDTLGPGEFDDPNPPADDTDTPGSGDIEPAPAGSGDSTPGQSGDAPGQSGEAPGQSGEAPGQSGEAPGQSGEAPGQGAGTPGRAATAPGQDSPGQSAAAPGRSFSARATGAAIPSDRRAGRAVGAPAGPNRGSAPVVIRQPLGQLDIDISAVTRNLTRPAAPRLSSGLDAPPRTATAAAPLPQAGRPAPEPRPATRAAHPQTVMEEGTGAATETETETGVATGTGRGTGKAMATETDPSRRVSPA